MSHIDASALASYNSLLDPHLSGYFGNNQMKRHLRKAGLIRKNGEIISENTYRLQMARKEHKKHVRELLAQAIVHRTLDMERARQVAIKQKLEEIAKIEQVRRVRSDRGRRGDEDILPLLTPRASSRPGTAAQRSRSTGPRSSRPRSAPNKHRSNSADSKVLVVDEDGMPVSPRSASSSPDSSPERSSPRGKSSRGKKGKYPKGELDDKHLYSLDRQTLYEYTMARQSIEQGHGPSPYRYPQLPPEGSAPPRKSPRPRTAKGKGGKEPKQQQRQGKGKKKDPVEGNLMLHRPEPAMKHQERVQTLCDVTVHYFGSNLKLDYEKFDPRDDIMVEQQHCGGNTLPVFREKVLPGHDFTFTSRRHRGFPFGLTFYINGVEDCRLSACCEYKHHSGSRLGGKKGHFGIVGVSGSSPCFKCQLNAESSSAKKDKKGKKSKKGDGKDGKEQRKGDENNETARSDTDVQGYGDQSTRRTSRDDIKVPVESDEEDAKAEAQYDNDFEEEDETDRSSRPKSRTSSRSSSTRSSSSRSSSSGSRSTGRSSSTGTKKSDKDEKNGNKDKESTPRKSDSDSPRSTTSSRSPRSSSEERPEEKKKEKKTSAEKKKKSKKEKKRETSDSDSESKEETSDSEPEDKPKKKKSKKEKKKQSSDSSSEEEKTKKSKKDTSDAEPEEKPKKSKKKKKATKEESESDTAEKPKKSKKKTKSEKKKKEKSKKKDSEEEQKEKNDTSSSDSDKEQKILTPTPPKEPKKDGAQRKTKTKEPKPEEKEKSDSQSSHDSEREQEPQSVEQQENAPESQSEKTVKTGPDDKPAETSPQSEQQAEESTPRSEDGEASKREDEEKTERESYVEPSVADSKEEKQEAPVLVATQDPLTPDGTTDAREDPDKDTARDVVGTQLSAIGVLPGKPVEGSIRPRIEGKREIDLAVIDLTDAQVAELVEVIQENGRVETLTLRNCSIDRSRLDSIASALAKTPPSDLRMLNLNCGKLDEDAMETVVQIVKDKPNLEVLLLHGNPLGDAGVTRLVDGLLNIDHLRRAAPTSDPEVQAAARTVAEAVMEDVLKSDSMASVLDANSSADSIAALVAGMRMPHEKGVAAGLQLEMLDLGDCGMTEVGAKKLSELIEANTGLQTLSLTGNKGLDVAGWRAIGDSLRGNKVLKTLSLDYSDLGDAGAAIVAAALKQNTCIEALDLEGNRIGNEGARSLLEMLQENGSIGDLTLMPGNNIDEALQQQIKDSLLRRLVVS